VAVGFFLGWPLIVSTVARAETRPPAVDVLGDTAVVYDVPPRCPSRSAFDARLRSRTAGHGAPLVALRRVEAHVKETASRTSASVLITDANGVSTSRSIVAASCNEAIDALALIVALTLDPVARAGATSDAGGTTSGTSTSSSTTSGASPGGAASDGRGADGASATNGDAANAATGANGNAANGNAAADASAKSAAAANAMNAADEVSPRPDAADSPNRRGANGRAAPRFGVAGAFVAASGVGPDLEPGGEGALELHLEPHLEVRAGGRFAASQRVSRVAGDAAFSWWTAFASFCAGTALGTSDVVVNLCGTYELGFLDGSGSNTTNPASTNSAWHALGPGLRAEWVLVGPMVLAAAIDGLVPLRRQRFSIADDVVYRVPVVAPRVEAGIGLRF
jgi:hypothetical protein